MKNSESAERAEELLKLLRQGWHTYADIAAATGWHEGTIAKWLHTWLPSGIVVSKLSTRTGNQRTACTLFTLADAWRGPHEPRQAPRLLRP